MGGYPLDRLVEGCYLANFAPTLMQSVLDPGQFDDVVAEAIKSGVDAAVAGG
ncbi:hypothetical protein [Mycolicibacterium sphagni]|uniref:hypothetical protein n=1 Tax=Mycolicibacterium sphagni TaxID=1786 RepID=UPI0021F2CDCF|nr:hypothetical protein [Mycolicibacterium sphagni]MCV7177868.1 hypothetical protein [Mycolicibacterium sphagni]